MEPLRRVPPCVEATPRSARSLKKIIRKCLQHCLSHITQNRADVQFGSLPYFLPRFSCVTSSAPERLRRPRATVDHMKLRNYYDNSDTRHTARKRQLMRFREIFSRHEQMYRPRLALYLLPSHKSPVTRLAFLSLQTPFVPSENEMDTDGGNHWHRAAAAEFLRPEEVNAFDCRIQSVSPAGTSR